MANLLLRNMKNMKFTTSDDFGAARLGNGSSVRVEVDSPRVHRGPVKPTVSVKDDNSFRVRWPDVACGRIKQRKRWVQS